MTFERLPLSRRWVPLFFVLVLLAPTAAAARAPAPRLLPEKTVLYVGVPNTQELVKRFLNSSLGRMSQDPQLQPLVRHFYNQVVEATAEPTKRLGLSLNDLLAIPQGEVAFALVAVEDQTPVPVFLLDSGEEVARLRLLLQNSMQLLEKAGGRKVEENVAGAQVVSYEGLGQRGQKVTFCEKDGVLVASLSPEIVKSILAAWDGGSETLAQNYKFSAITRRCGGTKGEEAQIIAFADPIAIYRAAAQGNPAMQIGLAMLPTLGLDGLSAIGVSYCFDAGQLDSIVHAHLLLDNPRTGIVELLALESGDTTPENWVPADIVQYMTLHWNFQRSYKTAGKLFDSFRGEGSFAQEVERRILEPTGVDVGKELLPNLDGRVSYMTWIERPVTINSQAWAVGLKIKDAAAVGKLLETVFSKNGNQLSRQATSTYQYYQTIVGDQPAEPGPGPRRPQITFGVLDNYLVIADRPSLYQKLIATLEKPDDSLGKTLDYKLVASRITRRAGSAKPGMISFDRAEEGMRYLHELAASDSGRERMRQQQFNPLFRTLNSALEANPLPPYAVIEQYLAPGGALMTDDETGLHYTAFSLRRK